MTTRHTVEFDTREALAEALRRIKAAGGDLSQVLIYTATSPPKAVMASDIYDTWARSREASTAPRSPLPSTSDDAAPDGDKAPRRRKSVKTRGNDG